MKIIFTQLFLFFFILFSLRSSAQTGQQVPELVNFDAAMLNLLNTYNVPGGQLAITYQGRLVYNRGFGVANTSTMDPVQPDNIFRIASISKPITSIAIMQLIENGFLNLNDTVFGPNGILNDSIYSTILDARIYNITLENLLNHSGGWDRNISGDPMFNSYVIATTMGVSPPADAVSVIRYMLANQNLNFTPGTQYQYSNFGYCILGRVIEKISGLSYEDYVRNNILLPLNITDMRLGLNLEANRWPLEVNYYDYPGAPYALSVYDNSTSVAWPYGGFNIEAMDAHGGWVCSASNLCKLLTVVDGFNSVPDILLPSTINMMTTASATNSNYALGWAVNSANNWWHSGSLPGTETEFVRANNQMNWALFVNTRPANPAALETAIDALVWNVIPTISTWPTRDQFTGITENNSGFTISIAPNPSTGLFKILSDKNIESIEITNLIGERVYQNVPDSKGLSHEVDLQSQPAGFYFVNIISGNKNYSEKIVKQ